MKFILSTCFILFLSVAAAAQCSNDIVRDQLSSFTERLEGEGYPMVYLTRCGSLDEGASRSHEVALYGGVTYRIFAVCDGDCPDLDLKLYDANGNLVDDDTLDDYVPVVSVAPTKSGSYHAEVLMYDCDVEPCYYALRVAAE